MTKQALISISKFVFVILAFANTACEMKIASDNNINGNQLLSNNLSGNGSPGMQNFRPANAVAGGNDLRPNNIPILPASIEAEQARARNVINTMAVQNNPFAEVIQATNAQPSTVVATYRPVNPPANGAVQAGITAPPVAILPASVQTGGRAPTSVAQQSAPPPSGGGGETMR